MSTKWTNQKLFEQIVENLREDGRLPDILDYALPDYDTEKITTY